MAFDYSGLKATADRLIKKFGSQVTIRDASGSTSFTVYIVKKSFMKGLLPDTLVQTSSNDAYLTTIPASNEIEPTLYVEFDASNIKIINNVKKIQPGPVLLAYEVEVEL